MGIAVVEPAIVPDVFCSGRFPPEDLGDGNLRFTFYVKQKTFDGDEEHIIVARLVIPATAECQGIPDVCRALGIKTLRHLAH